MIEGETKQRKIVLVKKRSMDAPFTIWLSTEEIKLLNRDAKRHSRNVQDHARLLLRNAMLSQPK